MIEKKKDNARGETLSGLLRKRASERDDPPRGAYRFRYIIDDDQPVATVLDVSYRRDAHR